jgi:hypothetical protein
MPDNHSRHPHRPLNTHKLTGVGAGEGARRFPTTGATLFAAKILPPANRAPFTKQKRPFHHSI